MADKEFQMPGGIVTDIGADGGEKEFWKRKADKVHFKKLDDAGRPIKKKDKNGMELKEYAENDFVVENIDQRMLFDRIKALDGNYSSTYSCFAVWQGLKMYLSKYTGIAHVVQSKLAEKAQMREAQVSKAMSELRKAQLIRDFDTTDDVPKGIALHPELIIIGDHDRARKLWKIAGEQLDRKNTTAAVQKKIEAREAVKAQRAAAEQQTQAIVLRIRERVLRGEEQDAALQAELSEVKDDGIRRDVEFEFTPAWNA